MVTGCGQDKDIWAVGHGRKLFLAHLKQLFKERVLTSGVWIQCRMTPFSFPFYDM